MNLQERFQQNIGRRDFLRGTVTGALGLYGAVLLGCEGDGNAEELIRKLLTTPFKEDELPRGLVSRGISAGNLDATSRAINVIGTVNINISEPNNPLASGGIGFTVFKDKKGPPQGIDVAKSQFPTSSWQKVNHDGIPSSAVLGRIDSFLGSVNIVLAPIGNVLVMAAYNNALMAVQLTKSGIAHLNRIK